MILFFKSYQHLFILNNIFFDICGKNKKKPKFFPKKMIISHSIMCDKKGLDHFRFLDSLIFLKKITATRSCIKKYTEITSKSNDDLLNLDHKFKFLITTQVVLKDKLLFLFLNYLKFVIIERTNKENLKKGLIMYSATKKDLTHFSSNKYITVNLYIKNPQYFCGCLNKFNFLKRKLCLNLFIRNNYNIFKLKNFWKTFLTF